MYYIEILNEIEKNYFGALTSNTMASTPKMIFGIQVANNGGAPPYTANVLENSINTIKLKEIRKPNMICSPIPPRTFLLAIETPITVRIIVAKGNTNLLYFSN